MNTPTRLQNDMDPHVDRLLHELWLLRQIHRLKRMCCQAERECNWPLHSLLNDQMRATRRDLARSKTQ